MRKWTKLRVLAILITGTACLHAVGAHAQHQIFYEGFELPPLASKWEISNEGRSATCPGTGSVKIQPGVGHGTTGTNGGIELWANPRDPNQIFQAKRNHLIAGYHLTTDYLTGSLRYELYTYIDGTNFGSTNGTPVNQGQTGPEFSLEDTFAMGSADYCPVKDRATGTFRLSRGATCTPIAAFQYLPSTTSGAAQWNIWTQVTPTTGGSPYPDWVLSKKVTTQILTDRWYRIVLIADFDTRMYRSLTITEVGAGKPDDYFDLSNIPLGAEQKFWEPSPQTSPPTYNPFDPGMVVTVENENRDNGCDTGNLAPDPTTFRVIYDDLRLDLLGTVLSNGTIQIGVNPQGQLIATGDTSLKQNSSFVGLRSLWNGWDALAWSPQGGVLAYGTKPIASSTSTPPDASTLIPTLPAIAYPLSDTTFTSDGMKATSISHISGASAPSNAILEMRHDFLPSVVTRYLYEAKVKVTNLSSHDSQVNYLRAENWNVGPTFKDTFQTILRGPSPTQRAPYIRDIQGFVWNGNSSWDVPLPFDYNGTFDDFGPDQQGTVFDLDLGKLAPSATREVSFFYGASPTEAEALAALRAVGAEAYSLLQPNYADGPDGDRLPDGPGNGTPHTVILAYSSHQGVPAISPRLHSVSPDVGGNCGDVTVTLRGEGFTPGMQFELTTHGGLILGGPSEVLDSTQISRRFNFRGLVAGTQLTIGLRNVNGALITAPIVVRVIECPLDLPCISVQPQDLPNPIPALTDLSPFQPISCARPTLALQLLGPPRISVGRTTAFTVSYRNLQNIDLTDIPVQLELVQPNTIVTLAPSTPSTTQVTQNGSTISLKIPRLAPGASGAFVAYVNASQAGPFTLTTSSNNTSLRPRLTSEAVTSLDPNEKFGTTGVGPRHFIAGRETLSYSIHFENHARASAPAQQITITDDLDPNIFDLESFSLTSIAIGSHQLTPSPGAQPYSADIYWPLVLTSYHNPNDDIVVKVDSSLDRDPLSAHYDRLTVTLTAIDPKTGLPPSSDPLRGFLPPNTRPPAGEGSISLSIALHDHLTHGQVIQNRATITFDQNPPLTTPPWINSIDSKAPTSRVHTLAATQSGPNFTVSWSGTDSGAGIIRYTLFAAENGSPYYAAISTEATATTFYGRAGSSYRFYTVAEDGVGNREASPGEPDATTTIEGAPPVEARRLQCSPDIRIRSKSKSGVRVRFRAPRVANNSKGFRYLCSHRSGSFFAPGKHRVRCSATGVSQRSIHCSFEISVTPH